MQFAYHFAIFISYEKPIIAYLVLRNLRLKLSMMNKILSSVGFS